MCSVPGLLSWLWLVEKESILQHLKRSHYFLPVKDSDDGNVEMECEDPVSPARTNSDGDDGTDSATMSQCQAQSDCESSGGNTCIIDLGCIIKPSMTTLKEVCDAIDKLDNGQKYKLLIEHF